MIEIEDIYNKKIELLKFKNFLENNNFQEVFSLGYNYTNEYPFFMFITYGKGLIDVFKNIEFLLFDKYFELLNKFKEKKNAPKLSKPEYLKLRRITTQNLKNYFELLNIATIDNIFNERKLNFSELFFKTNLTNSERIFLIKHELEHIKNDYFKYILTSLSSEPYNKLKLIKIIQEQTDLGKLFNIYADFIINNKLKIRDSNLQLHMINDKNILEIFPNLDLNFIKNSKDNNKLFNYFVNYLSNNSNTISFSNPLIKEYIPDNPELNNLIKNYFDIVFELKKFYRKEDISLINSFIDKYFDFLSEPLSIKKTQISNLSAAVLNQ